jgi:rSAM/selenodomain-associated transferase 1
MTDALYIAAKAPRPGLAKTRLGAVIGAEAALTLYRGCLRDLAARFTRAKLPLAWYVTPPDAWGELAPLLPGAARTAPVFAQPAGDWTWRQQALFEAAATRGEERVVLLASDSPQLSVATLRAAFRLLERHEVVLGPVYDGGYYLLGLRGQHDVLRGVAMSTGNTLGDILARAADLRLSVGLLPATFDIDEAEDLRHLRAALRGLHDMPGTAAALRDIDRSLAPPTSQPTPAAAWVAAD